MSVLPFHLKKKTYMCILTIMVFCFFQNLSNQSFFFMNNWNFVFQCTWTITAFISTILIEIIIVFCEPYDLPFPISVTKVFSCFLTLKIQFKKGINVLENTNFHLNKTSIYFYASNSSNILDHKVRLTAVTESYSSVLVLLSIILTIHY